MNDVVTKMNPPEQAVAVAITPMDMLAMAMEKGSDLDLIERLMTLQERWEATQAKKAFDEALSQFKANPPELPKDKRVKYTNKNGETTSYNHASLGTGARVIGMALSPHGLSHRWRTEQLDGGMIRVTCILAHKMGHAEEIALQAGPDQSGGKNNIQAICSTVTYLERYTLFAAVGLAAEDQDNDGAGAEAELISAKQKKELIKLLGTDTAPFLKFANLNSLDEMHASKFDKAKEAISKRGSNANS